MAAHLQQPERPQPPPAGRTPRRLDPARFIRLGRGTLANIDAIAKVNVMPGGTHVAVLTNGQKLQVSRLQSRIIRERFLKL